MRMMGLDFGSKTVGVSVCDPLGLTAQAVETITRKEENKLRRTCQRIEALIGEYGITTIILGYPNWWADLPMPVYTFLEEYDFGGKTIIPFVTHGGSGFSGTVRTISELQPDALVSENTLSLSRNNVADSEEDVASWAESLGLN